MEHWVYSAWLNFNKSEVKSKMKFEIFKNRKGQYCFRLIASNGKIVCQSESYTRLLNCKNGIKSVKKCGKAKVVIV